MSRVDIDEYLLHMAAHEIPFSPSYLHDKWVNRGDLFDTEITTLLKCAAELSRTVDK
jgi:hypothetical protein